MRRCLDFGSLDKLNEKAMSGSGNVDFSVHGSRPNKSWLERVNDDFQLF